MYPAPPTTPVPLPAPDLLICARCHGIAFPYPDYRTAFATNTTQVGHCLNTHDCGAFFSLATTDPTHE